MKVGPVSEILAELSQWPKIDDDKIVIKVDNGEVLITFFERTSNIPAIYVLGKYVISVQSTGVIYKDLYTVSGVIDSVLNYTEFQKRQ